MAANTYNDAVDTRIVFKVYAVTSWAGGVLLLIVGPHFFPLELAGFPRAGGLVARIAGAAVVAAGCFAWPFSLVEDPNARRRALGWWAAGHLQVLSMTAVGIIGRIGEPGPGAQVALGALVTATVLLWHFNRTADGVPLSGLPSHTPLFGDPGQASVQRLRSTYEEQIRAAASQEERNRLARDLHDSVKQQIFAIQTSAATAQARFASDPSGASGALEQVRESAREAMAEMEAMLDQLRAAPLENVGLVEALKKQCDALRFRTGAEVHVTVGELPPSHSLPPGAHEVVLRVAQEALANVGRHARATHVTVTLEATEHSLQLRVEDDGVGFDAGRAGGGMGLGNMRSRAAAIGGTVAVTTQPGNGTLVRLSVPRAAPETDDIRFYRRRVLVWGLLFMSITAQTVWIAFRRTSEALVWYLPFAAWLAVMFGQAILGYMRVRRDRETK
jgi:signal transduction histidine kinase